MSFTRKILESVNEFMDKVLADETPLSGIDETDLGRERQARQDLRAQVPPRSPGDNPVAKLAQSGPDAAQKRKELQAKRVARIEDETRRKEEARKTAQDEEFRRVVERARQESASRSRPSAGSGGSGGPGGSGTGSRLTRSGMPGLGKKTDLEAHYKVLDLPYGAPFEDVKSAYRKLMRKYHPDLHSQSPKKHKAATELTMQLTQAYNALESYLTKK